MYEAKEKTHFEYNRLLWHHMSMYTSQWLMDYSKHKADIKKISLHKFLKGGEQLKSEERGELRLLWMQSCTQT